MTIIGTILQILLGIFFTPEGGIKWTRIEPSTARFEHFRYPRSFKYFMEKILPAMVFLVLALVILATIHWESLSKLLQYL